MLFSWYKASSFIENRISEIISSRLNFSNDNIDDFAAQQIDGSFQRFLKKNNIRLDREEKTFFLNGADVIDNGESRAIINAEVMCVSVGKW